jgi:hypothetical protein
MIEEISAEARAEIEQGKRLSEQPAHILFLSRDQWLAPG